MQRKPPSVVGGSRGVDPQRRPLLQSAFGLHPQSSPAPPSAYAPTMTMNMGNIGMTMSNMDNSLRGFVPPTTDSTPTPFWRPTALLDPHAPHPQYKPLPSGSGGLDLEFNDFLGGRDGSGFVHGDASIGDVTGSFQVPSSFSSLTTPSSVAPLNMGHSSLLPTTQRQLGPSSSASTSPTSDASSTRSMTTSAAMTGTSMARPAVPVVAATGAPDANDYSRFVDSTDEPDLSQQKIEQKNEKCQYHNCPNRARVSQAYGKFCNRHVIVAPCGFPGCRDKALVHSSMCDKHLAEGKEALHRILANRAQNVPVCRTFGCFKNDQGRGYCRGHEKLLMATGRLPKHINKRRLNSAYTMCSYPNCNKHSQRNHLCRTHGNVILKQAEEIAKQSTTGESFEDALARLQKEIRRCTHPTCTKNSQRDRLCTMHYYEKHNLSRDGVAAKDTDGQLSSTDAGGESDGEHGMCTMGGCTMQAHTNQGLCKYHLEQGVPTGSSTRSAEESTSNSDGSRNHQMCSIPGCGNVAPYASGLCQHHGNKTNQAIQITRMNPHTVTAGGSTFCIVMSCGVEAVPGNNVCEHHLNQRQFGTKLDVGRAPTYGEGSNYPNQGGSPFLSSATTAPDGSPTFAPGLDRFSSGGATGRMANLSVGGGLSSSTAESDARQALVTLNGATKQGGSNGNESRNGHSGSTTCANPMCNRESYGREFCESCQSMFSPLVVSVGDGNNTGSYQFPSLSMNNQSIQPEPETDTIWDPSQAKASGPKSRDICRVKDCTRLVSRAGLCDDHIRLFQAGSLSVDELTLRSRQLREEKERANAEAAAAAAAEMKQMGSPKIKKYFCKVDSCDKQAQKRGLCKRHFRLQESNSLPNSSPLAGPSSTSDHLGQPIPVYQSQNCRFPGCLENVNSATTLCPSHCRTTFCWQAGCENLVESPQFCEYHAYSRECAYEGCTFTANRDSSGCINHAMERRCSHEHCEQFANPRIDRCRLHVDNCNQQPCALCELHGLREHAQGKTSMGYSAVVRNGTSTMDIFHNSNGNNDFVDERELTRDSVFGERLL